VIIPRANVHNLMLKREIVEAVRRDFLTHTLRLSISLKDMI
jgi:hypothetical protein